MYWEFKYKNTFAAVHFTFRFRKDFLYFREKSGIYFPFQKNQEFPTNQEVSIPLL